MMCADHNLTYAEAILMFGPTYDQVVYSEGSGVLNTNMDPERRFFFHLFFNPLSDFFIHTRNQSFLCLDWEEGQDIVDVLSKDIGNHLTRAKKAVSGRQLTLIDVCLNNPKRKKILLSHFTYLSANEHIPLTNLKTEVESESGVYNPSRDFAHGSFDANRSSVYDKLFKTTNQNKFDYILSGHTHRAGGYEVAHCSSGRSVQFKVKAIGKNWVSRTEKPFVLIAGSAGPIAKQNINGEFKKWGHDMPNGNWVTYEQQTGNDKYKTFYIERDTAPEPVSVKPRFAVAMDYFNIMEDNGVFIEFESTKEDPTIFSIKMNPSIFPDKMIFKLEIKELILYYYSTKNVINTIVPERLINREDIWNPTTPSLYFGCVFDKDTFENHLKEIAITKTQLTFLSIKFNPINKEGFEQYNYESPWIYRVQMIDHRKLENIPTPLHYTPGQIPGVKANFKAIEIKTHKDAEIPDFRTYIDNFPEDYAG